VMLSIRCPFARRRGGASAPAWGMGTSSGPGRPTAAIGCSLPTVERAASGSGVDPAPPFRINDRTAVAANATIPATMPMLARLCDLDQFTTEGQAACLCSGSTEGVIVRGSDARSRNGFSRSIGAGKTIVVDCDEPSSSSVCR